VKRTLLKFSFFTIGIFCPSYGHSQQKNSAEPLQFKSSLTDSIRIVTLLKLSQEKQYVDLNESLDLSNQAMEIAEDKNWVWAKVKAYKQLALLATLKGDYTTATRLDNLNLQLVLANRDSSSIAEVLNFLGNDYSDIGIYDEAYYYFTQSYRVARSIHDTLKMAIAIYNIGRVLNEMGQYELALNHFDFSKKLSLAVNDKDGLVYLNNSAGEVYIRKKEYAKAEEAFLSALRSVRERDLTIIEPRVLKNLARLYFVLKRYDKAHAFYDTALSILRKTNNQFGMAEVNLGVSEILIAQNKFDEATRLIEKSLQTAQQNKAHKMEIDCFRQLSYLAERQGDFKNSLSCYKKYKQLEDSLYSSEMNEKLFQGQLRFETEIKDYEIAALNKVRAEQDTAIRREEFLRNVLVVVIALVAILLLTVYRSSQRRRRINELLLAHQKEIRQRSEELEKLNQVKNKFFSIISHDLRSPFNALAGILHLAHQKQLTPEEFKATTKDLKVQFDHARLLINNLLDWAMLQMDNLKIQPERIDMAALVDENFKLIETVSTKELKLINMVPPNSVAWADLNMLNLVLRNLLMNAVKFSDPDSSVEVRCNPDHANFLEISVKDYGTGISKEGQKLLFDQTTGYSTRGTRNEKGTGLGLILCKEFVEKNGGKIWFESEEGKGSTFYFTVPKPTA
jgi:signal transduction histidine kinase